MNTIVYNNYSKTCLKRPLKNDKTKVLKTNSSLMKVESIALLEHSAILLTCIKRQSIFKTKFWSSF